MTICDKLIRDVEDILIDLAEKTYQQGREFGGSICYNPQTGKYEIHNIKRGTRMSVEIDLRCPSGTSLVGTIHTHPLPESFSPEDIAPGQYIPCVLGFDGYLECIERPDLLREDIGWFRPRTKKQEIKLHERMMKKLRENPEKYGYCIVNIFEE